MPIAGVMAATTLITAAPIVRVIFGMAVDTGGWRFGESSILMTIQTSRFAVFTEQGIFCCSVVKLAFQPLGRFVTGNTIKAHRFLMRLVVTMTVDALRWRFSMLQIRFMTIGAVGLRVRTAQLEVGEAMVKRSFVQNNDDRISSLVFCMAAGALVGLDFCAKPMKSSLATDVACDIFMTIEAKLPLPFFVEQLVAAGTLAFKIRMHLDDLTGHDERLNILSGCVT